MVTPWLGQVPSWGAAAAASLSVFAASEAIGVSTCCGTSSSHGYTRATRGRRSRFGLPSVNMDG